MKAVFWIPFVSLAAAMAAASQANASEVLSHSQVIEHPSGPLPTTWIGSPRVSSRQVGAPGAAGRLSSLRCIWRVDLEIVRSAKMRSGTVLNATIRSDKVHELTRPGWCGNEAAAFAGQGTARDRALQARLHWHALEDTKAVVAQADAVARANSATG